MMKDSGSERQVDCRPGHFTGHIPVIVSDDDYIIFT
jgi:hypothetical protein